MRSAARVRLGISLLVATVAGSLAVVVPTPALGVEQAMRVDTVVPPTPFGAAGLEGGGVGSRFIEPETALFHMVGASWSGPAEGAPARIRVRTDAGWGPWTALETEEDDAPDAGSTEDRSDRSFSRPLFVDRAHGYELEAPGTDLKVHLVREDGSRVRLKPERRAHASDLPRIADRGSWGARPPRDRKSVV